MDYIIMTMGIPFSTKCFPAASTNVISSQ